MSTLQAKFVSVPEAGRRLGKSPQSVKRLIERGKLQAISIPGTHARVSLDQIEAFVPAPLRSGAAIAELDPHGRVGPRRVRRSRLMPRPRMRRSLWRRSPAPWPAARAPGARARPFRWARPPLGCQEGSKSASSAWRRHRRS